MTHVVGVDVGSAQVRVVLCAKTPSGQYAQIAQSIQSIAQLNERPGWYLQSFGQIFSRIEDGVRFFILYFEL